ncbi:MAG TPA: hypothetical protein ENH99_02940 [Candidatus Pacearchaeota archaeon]|nr:hypothetical protein [Candidatus Pacearchaeota archaeon]
MGDFVNRKRGQVTIFIIIAIVIVGIAALIFFLSSPGGETGTDLDEDNPQGFIQFCLEEEIDNAIEKVSLQGGSINPEHSILYNDSEIEYLCFTGEFYRTCVVQQSLLKEHIESEIENEIRDEVVNCFAQMEQVFSNQGFNVELTSGRTRVELLPERVIVGLDYDLTLTKGDVERFDSFDIVLNNNLYELTSIANSIIEWETSLGDAETTIYMTYYSDLKVEKKKQQDGSTIYILTDRNDGSKFQFASRSGVFPPGYGSTGVSAI